MNFFKKGAMLAAVALVCLSASEAFAGTGYYIWRAPRPSGSWDIGVTLTNTSAFNSFTATWLGVGTPFEDNNGNVNNVGLGNVAVDGFGSPSLTDQANHQAWAQTSVVTPVGGGWTTVNASGNFFSSEGTPALFKEEVVFHFIGFLQQGTSFMVQMYSNGTVVGPAIIVTVVQTIPLPPAVWAGLATMGAMGVFLVQRRRSRQLLV